MSRLFHFLLSLLAAFLLFSYQSPFTHGRVVDNGLARRSQYLSVADSIFAGASNAKLLSRAGPHSTSPGPITLKTLEVVAQARKERHVIPAQNRAMSFELDPAKDGAYTTDECYGCTPVFMVSGKVLCGSHFVEIGTGDKNNWDKDAGELFMENVLVPLEEEILEENKEKLGEEPLAVVFTPSTSDQDKLIYKNRIDGVGECEEETVVQVIKDAFPKARIHVVSYFREQAKFSGSHEDAPWGKIAFEWKSSASGGDGNNVLNVFAEDRWIVQAKFNADGGLISAENTPPGTPPLSGGSGAGSPPPVTPPL